MVRALLRPAIVLRLLRECRRVGLVAAMTSNGFWGRQPAQARRQLRTLQRAGLGSLALGLPLRITLVRGTDEIDLTDIVRGLGGAAGATRMYDLQPVGRARALPATLHRRYRRAIARQAEPVPDSE